MYRSQSEHNCFKKCLFKLLTLFAVVIMFIMMSGFSSSAEMVDSGTCGDDLTWTLNSDGLLIIRGTGEMENFKSAPWMESDVSVEKVVIEEGVTTIGTMAFSNCGHLTDVTISGTVTRIASFAFYSCRNLTEIIIPDSVTEIESGAFIFCSELKTVSLGSSVTVIGDNAFKDCYSLEEIVLPESLVSIGENAFRGCRALKDIVINGMITEIPYQAFSSCVNLISVTIPGSVSTIAYNAFYGCSSLTDVYFDGTQAQWADMSIGANNEYLENAQIHCNTSVAGALSEDSDVEAAAKFDEAQDEETLSYGNESIDVEIASDSNIEEAESEKSAGNYSTLLIFTAIVLIIAVCVMTLRIRNTRRKGEISAADMHSETLSGEGEGNMEQTLRFCPQCGSRRSEGGNFCGECGYHFPDRMSNTSSDSVL